MASNAAGNAGRALLGMGKRAPVMRPGNPINKIVNDLIGGTTPPTNAGTAAGSAPSNAPAAVVSTIIPSPRPTFSRNQFYYASQFVRDRRPPMKPGVTKYRRLGPGAEESRAEDPFYQLNIDPLREFENFPLLNNFMSRMAKIKGRDQTKLTWKSQRRIGKAIRRAKALQLIPSHSQRSR